MTQAFPFGAVAEHENRMCTVVENEPKRLPGVYGIYDLTNGKWYVGESLNLGGRRYDQEREFVRNPERQRLQREVPDLTKLVFVPLYYFIVDKKHLRDVEIAIIRNLDSIENGYNAIDDRRDPATLGRLIHSNKARAKQLAHRQTDEWRKDSSEWLNTPETMAKRLATQDTPEMKAKKRANQIAAAARPEVRARVAAAPTHTPEARAKRRASVKASWIKRREQLGPNGRR